MPERYPDDDTLLTLAADDETGVEFIPTGRTPYYLEFRKLVHRTLRAAARANDLRVYQDGDLTVGVRAGSCLIGDTPVDFAGEQGVTIAPGATRYVRLDADGEIRQSASLPAKRETFIPLALVTADASRITAVTDLRGRAFLASPSPASVGVKLGMSFTHPSALGGSSLDNLVGASPIDAVVDDVILTARSNLVSSSGGDSVAAVVKVNGVVVTTTHPSIDSASGAGFRSTARGDGSGAIVRDDAWAQVHRGDLVTVDLVRTAAGVVTGEAAGLAVAVTLRAR